jgi:hypothetical protein
LHFPTVCFLILFLSFSMFSPPFLCRFCENLAIFSLAFLLFILSLYPSPSFLWIVTY